MRFVTIEQTISCPRATISAATDTVSDVLGRAGYRRGLGFGASASYVHSFRPKWASGLAFFLCVPTVGVSLLFLLIKRKDYCTIVMEDGAYGVVALVSGRVPENLPRELEACVGHRSTGPSNSNGRDGWDGERDFTPAVLLAPAPSARRPPPVAQPVQPVQPMQAAQPAQPVQSAQPAQPAQPAYQAGQWAMPHAQPAAQSQVEPARAPERFSRPEPMIEPAAAASPDVPQAVAWRPPSRLAPALPPLNGHNPPPLSYARRPEQPEPEPYSSPAAEPVPIPAMNGHDQPPETAVQGVALGRSTVLNRARPVPQTVVQLDTGETLPVGVYHLLGREPVPSETDPPADLIRFDDAKLSVSKTHLAFGVDDIGFWVIDRQSTNGTTVLEPGGRRVPCLPWTRQYVPADSEVLIGQRRLSVKQLDGSAGE